MTGTLLDGSLHLGDEIEILPTHNKGRIRGLQSYQTKTEVSPPGGRTAVNISGINVDQIIRGDVLAQPGKYQTTKKIDVNFTLLKDASSPLQHNSEVKLFVGASEVQARVRVLGVDELRPGQKGWLQLELKQPIVTMRGDRYILRRPSPGETLGGGEIVDPFPSNRHKRFDKEILEKLSTIENGSPEEIILSVFEKSITLSINEVIKLSRLAEDVVTESIGRLVQQNQLVQLSDPKSSKDSSIITSEKSLRTLSEKVIQEIQKYLQINPLRSGMPKEELKEKLKIEPKAYQVFIRTWIQKGLLNDLGSLLTPPGYQVQFSTNQHASINQLLQRFSQSPFMPPTIKECQESVGSDLYVTLVDQKVLIPVSDEVVYKKEDYLTLIEETKKLFSLHPQLTLGEFRDMMKISRRYAQAFLEHLDAIGITVREGDIRKPKFGPK